jgi:hypothetical protein
MNATAKKTARRRCPTCRAKLSLWDRRTREYVGIDCVTVRPRRPLRAPNGAAVAA